MDKDCCFVNENSWFRYRVGAIIIEDGCVLMAKNEADPYYYSVGGGVHMGETAQEAIVREVYEETGIHYEIDRLAVVHENFFKGSGTLDNLICHEISFYFLMKSKGFKATDKNHHSVTASQIMENVYWIPIEKYGEYHAYPDFFKDKLDIILNSDNIEHIITNDY